MGKCGDTFAHLVELECSCVWGEGVTFRPFIIARRQAKGVVSLRLFFLYSNFASKIYTHTNMNIENKRELRFYICLLMGYALMVGGFFSPPLGAIGNSVIVASGILLCLGALCVGVDLKGCIHELRLLKEDLKDDTTAKD